MGGRSSDTAGSDYTHPFEYNPGSNSWTTKAATYPDNQVNNMACGVLTVAGTPQIYCVGGSAAGAAVATARVFSYNPVIDTLTTLSGDDWPGNAGTILPGGFAVVSNKLYILGGFNINVASTNQIWEFDPTAAVGSKWLQRVNTPVGIMYAPSAAIGGVIYVGGASDYVGGLVTDTTTSFSFNPATNTLGSIASIPRATGETRALVLNSKMYVLGGGRVAPNPSNEVDIYDPALNTWSTGLPFVNARRNFPADTDGTHIWLAGGYDGTALPTSTMEIFSSGVCGSPSATPTNTATTTPTATATGSPTCTPGNVVGNGGFETGTFAPWIVQDQLPPPVVSTDQAHSGTQSALLGSLSGAEPLGDSSIYQTITVPAGGGTLSYWYFPNTADSITFDWQDAYVTDTSGTILTTLMHVCENTGAWTNVTFDMAPYAGQTVRIEFLVHQDGFGDDTSMYVDDVTLGGGTCGTPSATPTATATATGSPSCTPGAWTTAAPVPAGIARYAYAKNGEDLYIISGVTTGGALTNAVRRYNATTNTWTPLANIGGTGTEAPAGAYMNGKIYVADGNGSAGFQIYDVASDTWSAGPARPGVASSYGAAAGAFNGNVYIVGGDTGTTITSVYNIAANTWSVGPVAPSAYQLGGYAQIGQYLYCVGSFTASAATNSTVSMRLDMSTNTWTTGPVFTAGRADFGLAPNGTKIVAIGGDANGGGFFDASAQVDELDTSTWPAGSWVASPANLPSVRQANESRVL